LEVGNERWKAGQAACSVIAVGYNEHLIIASKSPKSRPLIADL